MDNAPFEALLEQVQKLSAVERLRMMELLAAALQNDLVRQVGKDWHTALRATYGIQADDPLQRAPQPPLESRDPIE